MSANLCVCCGAVIPEGRLVCPNCERKLADAPLNLKPNQANREHYNAYHREYYQKHREKINARRRELAKEVTKVIRCKDCVFFNRYAHYKDGTVQQMCQMGFSTTPEGFCHRAKHK